MNSRERIPLPTVTRLVPPMAFVERALALGVRLQAPELARLGDYLALLLAMNERLNLTTILDPDAAWERHILDALSLVPELGDLASGARVADLGSGGGVPGLPLAILRPDLKLTLIESTQKKCAFLQDATSFLGLVNVRVLAERVETVGKGPLARSFDAVTARGLAPLERLVPLAAPLLMDTGRMLFIKGQRADEELTAAARVMAKARMRHSLTRLTTTGRVVVLETNGTR